MMLTLTLSLSLSLSLYVLAGSLLLYFIYVFFIPIFAPPYGTQIKKWSEQKRENVNICLSFVWKHIFLFAILEVNARRERESMSMSESVPNVPNYYISTLLLHNNTNPLHSVEWIYIHTTKTFDYIILTI